MGRVAAYAGITVAVKKFAEFFGNQGLVVDDQEFVVKPLVVHIQSLISAVIMISWW
ncbi:hypothetical protein D3C85_1601480 [compost metagenome]